MISIRGQIPRFAANAPRHVVLRHRAAGVCGRLARAFHPFFPRQSLACFAPGPDIPPVSGVIYTVEPGSASALRGDPIDFTVDVQAGAPTDLKTGDFCEKRRLAVTLRSA